MAIYSVPRLLRIVVYVPPDEVERAKELFSSLIEDDNSATVEKCNRLEKLNLTFAPSKPGKNTKTTAMEACTRIIDDSEGDCLAKAYTGHNDKFGPSTWSMCASIPIIALEDFQKRNPKWNYDEFMDWLCLNIGNILDDLEPHLKLTRIYAIA